MAVRQHRLSNRTSPVDSEHLRGGGGHAHRNRDLCRNRGAVGFVGSDQRLQLLMGKPNGICVAGVAKAIRQGPSIHPVLALPPGMCRLDHVHAFDLHSIACFVLGHERFVKLLSRSNADGLDCAAGRNAFSQIDHLHARDLGHKDLAAVHLLQAEDHEADALIKRDPEAGHTRVGNRDFASFTLLEKHWNHTATGAHHVAVTRTTEARVLHSGVGIRLDKHLLGTKLGRTVQVHRINGLIRAQCNNAVDALIDRCINDVFATHDVGLDSLKGVVLAGRHLLQGSGMYNYGYSVQGPLEPSWVAHIPNEVAQAGEIQTRGAHVVLLQFVPAEDDYLLWAILAQHNLHKFLAERARSARDQDHLFRPIHPKDLTEVVPNYARPI